MFALLFHLLSSCAPLISLIMFTYRLTSTLCLPPLYLTFSWTVYPLFPTSPRLPRPVLAYATRLESIFNRAICSPIASTSIAVSTFPLILLHSIPCFSVSISCYSGKSRPDISLLPRESSIVPVLPFPSPFILLNLVLSSSILRFFLVHLLQYSNMFQTACWTSILYPDLQSLLSSIFPLSQILFAR